MGKYIVHAIKPFLTSEQEAKVLPYLMMTHSDPGFISKFSINSVILSTYLIMQILTLLKEKCILVTI